MTLDEYLASPDFQKFKDEALRTEAIRAADIILSRSSAIKRNQIHSIPSVIQGAGFNGIAELAKKQKEKNTNSKNKAFWTEMDGLLSKVSVSDISLFGFVKTMLLHRGIIEAEDNIQDKKAQKQIRKRNNDLVEIVIQQILPVYFEHFNCHYCYRIQGGSQ